MSFIEELSFLIVVSPYTEKRTEETQKLKSRIVLNLLKKKNTSFIYKANTKMSYSPKRRKSCGRPLKLDVMDSGRPCRVASAATR